MCNRRRTTQWQRRVVSPVLLLLTIWTVAGQVGASAMGRAGVDHRATSGQQCRAHLRGRQYRLHESDGLAAYVRSLETEIARSIREEPLAEAREQDPLRNREPKNHVDKKLRRAMEETRVAARELAGATGPDRDRLLQELCVMADGLRAAMMRVVPNDMEFSTVIMNYARLRYPPVGLGRAGLSTNLAGESADPDRSDPVQPSKYWTKPVDIAALDLYHGFNRRALPRLDDVVCTYRRSKQSRGAHAGLEVKCDELGRVKLKFGEEFSQPFAHRIFWALGYHTTPVDCMPHVKVKWDRRIFTEFNTRKNEAMAVRMLGLPVYRSYLQRYRDPLFPVSEVVMLDDQGREVSLKPEPNWDEFKRKLYKNPRGRPETVADNFNEAFVDRIKYVVYRNVNFQLKNDRDDDNDDDGIYLGSWDWNADGNPGLRELRGFAFLSAWLNQFDAWAHNNELYMIKQAGHRTFRGVFTDLGGCLGAANDVLTIEPQSPNHYPWSFTHPAIAGETAIPLDRNFHNLRKNRAYVQADLHDARWMAHYIAQLTGQQIRVALVASGMPSAHVRLYYNKLVHRRNKALTDLGLAYPPIPRLDDNDRFDYDPRRDGLMSIVNVHHETVAAPDDDWIVVKGRVEKRGDRAGR